MNTENLRDIVVDVLLHAPARIESAEVALLRQQERVQHFRDALAEKEADLLLGRATRQCACVDATGVRNIACDICTLGLVDIVIDGKNEAQRAAQMRDHTRVERDGLAGAESALTYKRIDLQRLRDEFASARALARIVGSEVD